MEKVEAKEIFVYRTLPIAGYGIPRLSRIEGMNLESESSSLNPANFPNFLRGMS